MVPSRVSWCLLLAVTWPTSLGAARRPVTSKCRWHMITFQVCRRLRPHTRRLLLRNRTHLPRNRTALLPPSSSADRLKVLVVLLRDSAARLRLLHRMVRLRLLHSSAVLRKGLADRHKDSVDLHKDSVDLHKVLVVPHKVQVLLCSAVVLLRNCLRSQSERRKAMVL